MENVFQKSAFIVANTMPWCQTLIFFSFLAHSFLCDCLWKPVEHLGEGEQWWSRNSLAGSIDCSATILTVLLDRYLLGQFVDSVHV